MITNYYQPFHENSKEFNLELEKNNIMQRTEQIFFYNNTPHKDFIIKDVLYSIYNIPRYKVSVIETENNCPVDIKCYSWDSKLKVLELK